MNPKVDKFLIDGCMRCKYGATPDCKVHNWTAELQMLRAIVQDSELVEDLKWGFPCYTLNDKNVLMITAFKNFCGISFFKGALLKDTKKILEKQGEKTQSTRVLKFTNVEQIEKLQKQISAFIKEAIEVEKAGKKVVTEKKPEPIPEELINAFKENAQLKKAFFALTPGRQRGYILHFSQPKKSETRTSRIKKCTEMILSGVGLHDKYSC